MVEIKCRLCKWKGAAELREKTEGEVTIEYIDCPDCGAHIFSRTLNGNKMERKK